MSAPGSFSSVDLRPGIAALVLAVGIAIYFAVFAGSAATPASGHYEYFSGGVYQDWYVPYNERRCIYDGGGDDIYGCMNHSYSFISAEDIGGANGICAMLFNRTNHDLWSAHCGSDFVRHCSPGQNHSSNQLDCHDQDSNQRHAGASNGGSGTTIRMHGTY